MADANTKIVTSQIEINASPSQVRSVFFDLPAWSSWSKGPGVMSITPAQPEQKGIDIQAGDKIKVGLTGMGFSPVVLENTPEKFTWRGGIWGLFHGDHSFKFQHSEKTPGMTTFVNEEVYFGPLVWVIQKTSSMLESHNGDNYMIFNRDFKSRVESVKES